MSLSCAKYCKLVKKNTTEKKNNTNKTKNIVMHQKSRILIAKLKTKINVLQRNISFNIIVHGHAKGREEKRD